MIEADVGDTGGDLLDRVTRAVAPTDRDLQTLLGEVALLLRHEERRVVPADGEVEDDGHPVRGMGRFERQHDSNERERDG